jgi:hypothetical protein
MRVVVVVVKVQSVDIEIIQGIKFGNPQMDGFIYKEDVIENQSKRIIDKKVANIPCRYYFNIFSSFAFSMAFIRE